MPRVFADPLQARVGRYGLILAIDGAVAATSLHAAMALRFDGVVPEPWAGIMPRAVALVVAVRLAANLAARLHCWSFPLSGLPDAVRIAMAATIGSALFVVLAPWVAPPGLPRTVFALEFFMSSSSFAVVRFGPRVVVRWWSERRRRHSGAAPTLVVGVNFAAELLARDIVRSPQRRYDLVGFVGTDPSEIGRRLDGKPILGVVQDLRHPHRAPPHRRRPARDPASRRGEPPRDHRGLRDLPRPVQDPPGVRRHLAAPLGGDARRHVARGPAAARHRRVRRSRDAAPRRRAPRARHRRRRLHRRRDLRASSRGTGSGSSCWST